MTSRIAFTLILLTSILWSCKPEPVEPTPTPRTGPPEILATLLSNQSYETVGEEVVVTGERYTFLQVQLKFSIPEGYVSGTFGPDPLEDAVSNSNLSPGDTTGSMELGFFIVNWSGKTEWITIEDSKGQTARIRIDIRVPSLVDPSTALPGSWTRTDSLQTYVTSSTVTSDGTLVILAGDEIITSTDQGASWHARTISGVQALASLAEHPNGDWYLSTNMAESGGKILKSTDKGQTWTTLSTNLPAFFGFPFLHISPNGQMIVSATGNNNGLEDGGYISTDGLNWTFMDHFNQGFILSMAFDEDSLMVAGADAEGTISVSEDGGKSWNTYSTGRQEIGSIRLFDTYWLATCSGGVIRSEDRGKTWISFSEGLPIVDTFPGKLCETKDGTLYTTLPGAGVFQLNGDTWKSVGTDLSTAPVVNALESGSELVAVTLFGDIYQLD